MKKIACLFSLFFLVITHSLPAFATEKNVNQKTKVRQITGLVKTINTEEKTITLTKKIKKQPVDTVVHVVEKTKFKLEKENKAFSDVKVGDKVTVKFIEANGKNVEKKIMIRTSVSPTAKK